MLTYFLAVSRFMFLAIQLKFEWWLSFSDHSTFIRLIMQLIVYNKSLCRFQFIFIVFIRWLSHHNLSKQCLLFLTIFLMFGIFLFVVNSVNESTLFVLFWIFSTLAPIQRNHASTVEIIREGFAGPGVVGLTHILAPS